VKNYRQVLVFDVREGFRNPVARMGPIEVLTVPDHYIRKGRYAKGSVKDNWFARGEDLYDLRNTHQMVGPQCYCLGRLPVLSQKLSRLRGRVHIRWHTLFLTIQPLYVMDVTSCHSLIIEIIELQRRINKVAVGRG
jgi:hypothetical protein